MKIIKNNQGVEILIQHGQGVQMFPDGSKYEGVWHEGKMQGYGKLIQAGQGVYEGEFYQDRANGKGVFYYYTGDSYDGEWVDDKPHG